MKNLLRLLMWTMAFGGAWAGSRMTPWLSGAEPPRGMGTPRSTILYTGSGPVTAVAYRIDGRFLAVASGDNGIRIFDARAGGKLAKALSGHTGPILAMGFKDTNRLVSVSQDRTVKVWDIVSAKLMHSTALNFEKQSVLAMAPGQEPLVVSSALRRVSLWNYESEKLLQSFEANDSEVAALAFTPDGKLLVIGTTKGVVRVMDVGAWKVTRMIDLDTPIYSLAASMSHIAVGYGKGTVALLNLSGEQDSIPEVERQSGKVNAVAFSAKGDRFASASADGRVKLWDTKTLQLLASYEGHHCEVLAVAFSPEGQHMTSGGSDGRVICWTVP